MLAASCLLVSTFPLELETGGQHGGGDGIGGEAGGQIHYQLLGGKQHARLLHAAHPADGGLDLAGAAGAIHPQYLPAVAAVALRRRNQRVGRGHIVLMLMLMLMIVSWR